MIGGITHLYQAAQHEHNLSEEPNSDDGRHHTLIRQHTMSMI